MKSDEKWSKMDWTMEVWTIGPLELDWTFTRVAAG